MSGSVAIVGLGPGQSELMTPAARAALARATDFIGYGPYIDRIPDIRDDQVRHATDNRVELERARHALMLAAEGRHVAVVSGGDPGVFAMASAVFEAVEMGEPVWRKLEYPCRTGRNGDARCGGGSGGAAGLRFLRGLAVR